MLGLWRCGSTESKNTMCFLTFATTDLQIHMVFFKLEIPAWQKHMCFWWFAATNLQMSMVFFKVEIPSLKKTMRIRRFVAADLKKHMVFFKVGLSCLKKTMVICRIVDAIVKKHMVFSKSKCRVWKIPCVFVNLSWRMFKNTSFFYSPPSLLFINPTLSYIFFMKSLKTEGFP